MSSCGGDSSPGDGTSPINDDSFSSPLSKRDNISSSCQVFSPSKRSARDFVELHSEDDDDDSSDSSKGTPHQVKRQKVEQKEASSKEENDDNDVSNGDDDGGNVYHIDGESDDGSEEEELVVCQHCGATPCDWTQYQDDVIEFARNNHFFVNHTDPDDARSFPMENFMTMTEDEKNEIKMVHQDYKKRCFRHYTRLKYGTLGLGNRIKHPICIENAIRSMFPNHDNSIVGYHSS